MPTVVNDCRTISSSKRQAVQGNCTSDNPGMAIAQQVMRYAIASL